MQNKQTHEGSSLREVLNMKEFDNVENQSVSNPENANQPASRFSSFAERINATLFKWLAAVPAFSFLLACANEDAFHGKHPLWELLRGTGGNGGN
jgi:hypothetical protein